MCFSVNRAALESPSCPGVYTGSPNYPGIYLSICLPIYLSSPSCPGVYTRSPSCPGIYLSIYLPIVAQLPRCIYRTTQLPRYLSIYRRPAAQVSIYLSICLSIYLSVCLSIVAQLPRCIYRITQLPRYLSNYLLSPSCPGVPEKDLGRRDLTGVARLFGWPVGQGSQSHPRTHGPPPARRSPRRRPRRTSPRRRRRGPRGSQQTRCEKREAGCAARGQSGGRRAGAGARSRGRGRTRGARVPQPASRARTGCSSGARGECAASARFGNVPVEGGRPGSGEGSRALETPGRRAPRGGSPSGRPGVRAAAGEGGGGRPGAGLGARPPRGPVGGPAGGRWLQSLRGPGPGADPR